MSVLQFPDPPLADGVFAVRPWRTPDIEQKLGSFSDRYASSFSWPRIEPRADVLAGQHRVSARGGTGADSRAEACCHRTFPSRASDVTR